MGRNCPSALGQGGTLSIFANWCRGKENVDIYIHSPIRLHGVVLSYLSTETTFYFYLESGLILLRIRTSGGHARKWLWHLGRTKLVTATATATNCKFNLLSNHQTTKSGIGGRQEELCVQYSHRSVLISTSFRHLEQAVEKADLCEIWI
jgi:hypothetical protein